MVFEVAPNIVSTLPHVDVKVTATASPVEHDPVHAPEVGQLQLADVHATLLGLTVQTWLVKLFVTCKAPPFTTRFVLVVPEIVISEVVVVVTSAKMTPLPEV